MVPSSPKISIYSDSACTTQPKKGDSLRIIYAKILFEPEKLETINWGNPDDQFNNAVLHVDFAEEQGELYWIEAYNDFTSDDSYEKYHKDQVVILAALENITFTETPKVDFY